MQLNPILPLDTSSTFGTTSVILLPECPIGQIRTQFSIQNISTTSQVVNLAYGKDAVANTGINLTVNAGVFEGIDSASKPWQGRICAVGSAASSLVTIHEVRAYDNGNV